MPIALLLFWIVLNGRITLEVLFIGIFVSAVVSVFAYKTLGIKWANEKKLYSKIGRIIAYLFLLVWEVVKANIHMIGLVLSWNKEIKPQIAYFKSPLNTQAAKVALANSITLTPGTITIKLEGDEFGVHAIDASNNEGIDSSVFVKKLKKIEGGH